MTDHKDIRDALEAYQHMVNNKHSSTYAFDVSFRDFDPAGCIETLIADLDAAHAALAQRQEAQTERVAFCVYPKCQTTGNTCTGDCSKVSAPQQATPEPVGEPVAWLKQYEDRGGAWSLDPMVILGPSEPQGYAAKYRPVAYCDTRHT
jgi:hypothetical protein